MDLDAYFQRINYTGSRRPGLFTLRALQAAHVQAVPFENLDILLGRRISMDLADVERKIVRDRRGGYCFEQNTLFAAVLRELGFRVTPLLGRVRWQVPAEVKTPLTHLVLRVEIDDRPWLADVGFGSVGAPFPLALDTDSPQHAPHETRRVIVRHGYLVHQLLVNERWADVYEFRPEEPAPLDLEMGNHFSCSHPKANFVNNLLVAIVRPTHRAILYNRELTLRPFGGAAETRPVRSAAELTALLAEHFDLHFPAGTSFTVPNQPWDT